MWPIVVDFTNDRLLIILKSRDCSSQFRKIFDCTWFRIPFWEKSPNFKELAQKL